MMAEEHAGTPPTFDTATDPYLRPNTTFGSRLGRGLWLAVYVTLFRWSPRPLHGWRAFLLRAFGATIGPNAKIYPRARIWAPWNLECEDVVAIADDAIVYNPARVRLCSHSILSEQAYLCGASHDYTDRAFPTISAPITIGRYAWVCARASVQMGVTVHEGAILGLGAIATSDLEPWSIYAGIPARRVKARPRLV
ncbi:MAG TPA: putative colanic acid biosynthesis acetyltransferase [Gammaproteobacteria bacterium]|nr:putative colanic acid biosynthesis acetyltransferase [Gammaproteobacteria bacterium]